MTFVRAIGFVIPAAAVAAAYFISPQPDLWYAYVIVLAAAEVAIYYLFEAMNRDIEFLSGYYTEVRHYYPWVELVTVTRTVSDGRGHTRTVTEQHHVPHPDSWSALLNTGREIGLSQRAFLSAARLWQTGTNYFPTHHPGQISGGGGESSAWNGRQDTMQTATYKSRYKNYIQNTNSIFNPARVTRDEAKSEGLIPYPEIIDNTQNPLCVSPLLDFTFSADDQLLMRRLNASLGNEYQIHFFVLLFPAEKGVNISMRQRQYWEGGNKNEFTICLGMEKEKDGDGEQDGNSWKVKWCKPFSWMDAPTLEVATRDWYISNPGLDITALAQFLSENISLWERKQFSEFKYLGRHLSSWKSVLYLFITLCISALCVFILWKLFGFQIIPPSQI